MGIFSDIMNLKDRVWFCDSLVLSQQRVVVGVILAMVETDLGERKLGFDFDKIEALHVGVEVRPH